MTVRAAATSACCALLVAACQPHVTDLLPPLAVLSGCATDIDVYGADDTLFPACGGPASAAPLAAGRFAPGIADYDATLAGRLQAALSADPDLAARFPGRTFRVRACGSTAMYLSSLAPSAVNDECQDADAPVVDPAVAEACRDHPAGVVILVASEPLDRCHGGGADTSRADEPARYAAHYAARLQAFLAARSPSLALIGSATGWTPLPGSAEATASTCGWSRGLWGRLGLGAFAAAHPEAPGVALVWDRAESFQAHSRCCGPLGLPCEEPAWLSSPPQGGAAPWPASCAGAAAIASYWIAVVRGALEERRFACEG